MFSEASANDAAASMHVSVRMDFMGLEMVFQQETAGRFRNHDGVSFYCAGSAADASASGIFR
jgi:hypothetical protein